MKNDPAFANVLSAIIVLASSLYMFQATPTLNQGPDDSAATPITDQGLVTLNCTLPSDAISGPIDSEECIRSKPWWTSWSNCPITPIHSEPFPPATGMDAGLARIPWIEISTPNARIVGHQFFGNRPLPTNGVFPDGSVSKVLWHFDQPVTGLTLMGKNLWNDNGSLEQQSAVSVADANAFFDQWPSQLIFPESGCWELQVTAENQEGVIISGEAIFLVVP